MKSFLKLICISLPLGAAAQLLAEEPSEPGVRLDLDHGEHEAHKHHVGIFLGGATRFKDGHADTGLTLGLDYTYRVAAKWGVGGVVEGVAFAGQHRDLALAAGVIWYPVGALRLSAGPGFETDGHHTEFLFRLSVGYGFELGKFILSPEVAVDLTHKAQTLVYGFSIGRGF